MIDHEKLDVYATAIEFLALGVTILEGLPRGHAHVADQLRRAALSIPLNIAEGSGKVADADRARFYAYARGSAMECAAIIDVLHVLRVIDSQIVPKAKHLLTRTVSMLSRMCR